MCCPEGQRIAYMVGNAIGGQCYWWAMLLVGDALAQGGSTSYFIAFI
jgi:hypothetical protein